MASQTRIEQYRRAGLTFDVVDTGPLDGRPVVLLHGFPQRAASWNDVAELLHKKGFRTIAPDQRGYSPGARPPRRRDYRQAELVDDVLALIDELDVEQVDVVGHDWGAAVAWMLAANHRDRVRTLTALSVPHPAAFIRAMPRGQIFLSWYMFAFQLPVVPEKVFGSLLRRGDMVARMGLPTHTAERVVGDIIEYGALRGALNWYRAMPFVDRRAQPRRVAVPTTYVWSDGDVALGKAGARLCADQVTGPYEFVTIRGATHWLPETRPVEVAGAIISRITAADDPGRGSVLPTSKDDQ